MPNGVNRLSSELHALCAAAAGSVTACKKTHPRRSSSAFVYYIIPAGPNKKGGCCLSRYISQR
jgi:hypothetical protein